MGEKEGRARGERVFIQLLSTPFRLYIEERNGELPHNLEELKSESDISGLEEFYTQFRGALLKEKWILASNSRKHAKPDRDTATSANTSKCAARPQLNNSLPTVTSAIHPNYCQCHPNYCRCHPDYCQCHPDYCQRLPDYCQCLPNCCQCFPDYCQCLPNSCQCFPNCCQCLLAGCRRFPSCCERRSDGSRLSEASPVPP